jgi:hypothetical protein
VTTGEIQQPRLRAVELIHLPGENGEPMACLRDRLDPDARPLMMSQGALMLASLMDGQRTLGEIRSGFMLRSGLAVTEEQLSRFVGQLDQAYLWGIPGRAGEPAVVSGCALHASRRPGQRPWATR